ncbi:MAG: hypothetical protein M0Q51_05625 [Bacteroidales bacterium]|nr:hypothetical protein [Bacteroidales bacterium]
MKKRVSITGLVVLVWITIFLGIDLNSYSQEEIAQATLQNDEFILKLPKASLRHTMADTILPTICNSGQGLLHYEIISIQNNEKGCNYNFKGGRNSTAIPEDYTESELKFLREQQRLMDEQYHYEVQQQIRKDKMDIGLEEIIKGFYMKPVF